MEMTIAEAKFLKTSAGVTAFARVEVEFRSDATHRQVEVRLALAHEPKRDDGEVNEQTAPDWCRAAVVGVNTALSILADVAPGTILITRIQGTVVDTTEDAVACAAGLATARAFGRVQLAISDRPPWKLISQS